MMTDHEPNTAQRQRFLRALIEQLDTEPFQPRYRLKPVGLLVTGWPNRLKSYFWPKPGVNDYVQTRPLWLEAEKLSRALQNTGGWSSRQKQDAVDLASKIFKWGRVPQKNFTAQMVEDVFRSALSYKSTLIHKHKHHGDAPMNSGWTKIAAFATAHLEDSDDAFPHAIWDSRVSTSITFRLDRLLVDEKVEESSDLFPRIGAVKGRGGTRPRDLKLSWAYAYGSWSSHFAGSVLVKEIRDILNTGGYPPMPLPGGGEGSWTIHGVGSVLFMDGY